MVSSKGQQIINNKKRLEFYRSELVKLETLWKAKQMKYHQDLAALIKDRDNVIGDMKVGAKCSNCGKYKSEFEKEGKDFQKHLGEVKGYAIPASTEELETTRKKYSELIAYKKVQIQNAEKGDKDLDYKRKQIDELNQSTESLSLELTNLKNRWAAFEIKKEESKTILEKTLEGFNKGMERYEHGGKGMEKYDRGGGAASKATLLKETLEKSSNTTTEPSKRSVIRNGSTIKPLPKN